MKAEASIDVLALRRQAETLLIALRARHSETSEHCRRTALYAVRLGCKLNIWPAELELLELGALLHDIGKLGVRDCVFEPRLLAKDERAEMHAHPRIGAGVLSQLGFPDDVVETVYQHHEHFDGTGYPRGLRGAAISRLARIVAVADAYDALTADRCYRRAVPHAVALAEIEAQSGVQFDPTVVSVLLQSEVEELLAC
jgi:putative nucleotidyltransferase with HDIG domain